MRRPKNWTKMLNQGFMTTDMVDGCLLQLVKTRQTIIGRINKLQKEDRDKPTKGRANRIADAQRRLYRTECKYDFLLGATELKAIVRYTNVHGKAFHYAIHAIGERTYVRPLSATEAKALSARRNLAITETHTVRFPSYDLENVPSFATVSEAIATMASAKVKLVADTGNFDPKSYEETDGQTDVDKRLTERVRKFAIWYTEAYQEISQEG